MMNAFPIRFILSLLITGFSMFNLNAQNKNFGIFEGFTDVGPVKYEGAFAYDEEPQEYRLMGSGANMWFGADEFSYLFRRIQGDFILRAEMRFEGKGHNPHRKIGWTVRNSLYAYSPHVSTALHGDGLTALQYRRGDKAETEEIRFSMEGADVVQLERKGNNFILSVAKFGEPFQETQNVEVELRNEIFAGLYICSHEADAVENAVFRNVRIVKPTWEGFEYYQDYLGSHMEVMDVETGHRKILFSGAHSFQAPNWTPDGGHLIYNSNGFLYDYNLETRKTAMFNTGFANRNNNDHVLTFDGKWMGISHHNPDDGGASSLYYLPVEGSDEPIKVTKSGVGASYFHGWTLDGNAMLFTGNRKGKYDIYSVAVEDGTEVQLTDTDGLDDGPEMSPDGKYIYFNSNRTGTMQIWRMKPDGSEPEQLTFDQYHDWFPHISPDGKWMVFISYGTDVESGDHPFYKQVMLRLMPAEGGTPRTIAYLYGGQGTINVPSWSPDSKKIAFVSNSGMMP